MDLVRNHKPPSGHRQATHHLVAHASAGEPLVGERITFRDDGTITQSGPVEHTTAEGALIVEWAGPIGTPNIEGSARFRQLVDEYGATVQIAHQHRVLEVCKTRAWVSGDTEAVEEMARTLLVESVARGERARTERTFSPVQAWERLEQAMAHLVDAPTVLMSHQVAHWLLWPYLPSAVPRWCGCDKDLIHDPEIVMSEDGRVWRRTNDQRYMPLPLCPNTPVEALVVEAFKGRHHFEAARSGYMWVLENVEVDDPKEQQRRTLAARLIQAGKDVDEVIDTVKILTE